jgi:SAM-dependent methyltransferase
MTDYQNVNRAQWNERADIHIADTTGFYAVDRFLAGEDVLFPIEAGEIGDVSGLKVLHLQCHVGIDTLCLVRRGAIATGVDFSPNALVHARNLALKSGLEARFVEGDVNDALALAGGGYDLVYTTWGTVGWLPDVARWGAVIASMLTAGGRLYFADSHPALALLEEIDGRIVPTFDWRTPPATPLEFTATTTYNGDPRLLTNQRSLEWIHPVSDILMALIDAGLAVERLNEHEMLPWAMFPSMVATENRLYQLPPGMPRMPCSLSLSAVKR